VLVLDTLSPQNVTNKKVHENQFNRKDTILLDSNFPPYVSK